MTDDSVVSISDVVSGTFGSLRASYYSGAERSSGAGGGSSMDVSEHSILGRGVFGVVYKDHLPVAVKKIRNYGLNAVKEVEVLKELSHVNIIRYYSHHTEDGGQNLCIIMEYADLGTLSSLIREEASDPESRYFMEKYNWRFLSQTSSALECLHLKHPTPGPQAGQHPGCDEQRDRRCPMEARRLWLAQASWRRRRGPLLLLCSYLLWNAQLHGA